MSKRNKIILILSIAVFLILSLVVSLVVVFGEEQNPVVRNINAAYKVYNADCSVSAKYVYGDNLANAKDFTVSGLEDGEKSLNFDLQNKFQQNMLKPTSDVVLTKENNSVIFAFEFKNFGNELFDVTVILEGVENKSNLTVKYSEDGVTWSNKNLRFDVEAKSGSVETVANYYVKVSLNDVEQEYNFNQNFEINIYNF